MNPFAERYKTFTNARLVEITLKPQDYQPAAVKAAEEELLTRDLPPEQLSAALAENQAVVDEKVVRVEKRRALGEQVKSFLFNIIEVLQPTETPRPIGIVVLIMSIFFGVFGITQLYQFAGFLIDMKHSGMPFLFSVMVPTLFMGVYLTLTAILFWMLHKWGWIFFTIFFALSLCSEIVFPVTGFFHFHYINRWYWFSGRWLTGLLFQSGCTWFVYRKDVRDLFRIDKMAAIAAPAVGMGISLFMLLLYWR